MAANNMGVLGVSFEDCPHNCKRGFLFNYHTGVRVPCPYCTEKRKSVVFNAKAGSEDIESVESALRVPKSYVGTAFNFTSIFGIRDYASIFSHSSLESLKEVTTDLVNKVSIGTVPDKTIALNFGFKSNPYAFIYPFLMKAYLGGLKTAPLINGGELGRLRYEMETSQNLDGVSDFLEELKRTGTKWGDKFEDYIDADVCLVYLDAGTTLANIRAVKGLMEWRAQHDKATIIVFGCYINLTKQLLKGDYQGDYLALAEFYTTQLDMESVNKLSVRLEKDGFLAYDMSPKDVGNLSTIQGYVEQDNPYESYENPNQDSDVPKMTEKQFADLFNTPLSIL